MTDSTAYDIIHWDPVDLIVSVSHGELLSIRFARENDEPPRGILRDPDTARFATEQIREYLAGKRREFDMPITLHGTSFQVKVWSALRGIPFGTTRTYGEVGHNIGRYGAGRAVGGAARRNKLPIVIPCHRVMAYDGLGGYTGGLDIKRALWSLEGISPDEQTPPPK